MNYRTKTYIAGDWTGDKNAIDKLYEWNDNENLSLSFTDAHDLTQARDTSLKCSIKQSLRIRMDVSKTFILVVGEKTNALTAGGCQYCDSYNRWTESCARGHSIDYRSYIEYECEKAYEAGIKILVLYNSTVVSKSKCPEILRNVGQHIPMLFNKNNFVYWNYPSVKEALDS